MKVKEESKQVSARIASLDRGLECLQILADNKRPMSNGELAKLLGVDKSTASRILYTLTARRLVEQEKESKKFVLGLRLLEYANSVVGRFDIRNKARPFAEELLESTGESVNIAILDGAYVIYLDKLDKPSLVNIGLRPGSRVPAHCISLGKALLASVPQQELSSLFPTDELVAFTEKTIRSVPELIEHLTVVRDRGVAMDLEEFYPGMRGIAAPIRDHDGRVIAAIGIAGPCTRITAERESELARLVRQAADDISYSLGWSS